MQDPLSTWKEGAAKRAILEFVARVAKEGTTDFIPLDERVAVFDNDGTLWCEKPMPIQADFVLRSLAEMAEKDPALREKQPWKSAVEKDYVWLGDTLVKHYQGDDTRVKILISGIEQAYGGMAVEEYETQSRAFLKTAQHPTLHRPYYTCVFAPMRELLDYLKANGFTNYIASGGDRDFMRVVANRLYGIPRQQIIGSSFGLQYDGDGVLYKPNLEVLDDGAQKPVRIWSRIGQRPILSVGNSNGDTEMLEFTGRIGHPALRLVILHDDARREFAYEAGAERVLQIARSKQWTIVSLQNDWSKVFPDLPTEMMQAAS